MLWPQMLIPTSDLNLQGTLTTSLLRMASNSICMSIFHEGIIFNTLLVTL